MERLLPGVPRRKPTDVARSSDLLLLTVPDDMLGNVVTTLAGAGAIRPGQYVVHTWADTAWPSSSPPAGSVRTWWRCTRR